MITAEDIKYENNEGKKEQKIDNEMELLKKIFKITPDTWNEIMKWGNENNILSPEQIQFLNLIPSGKFPSDAQSKKIVKIILFLENEGMKSIW
jgi:hypothetical protein